MQLTSPNKIISLFRCEMLFNMLANFCSKLLCNCFDVFGGTIHDSDQKGISFFNQYFKPNCLHFIALHIVSTEIGYTFFYIYCNASASFDFVFPLKCIHPDLEKRVWCSRRQQSFCDTNNFDILLIYKML